MRGSADLEMIEVAVVAPLMTSLTYQRPAGLELRRGQRVWVPLGRRKINGVALGPQSATDLDPERLKAVEGVDNDYPALSEKYLCWLLWLSQYYLYPIGQVMDLIYPPLRQSERTLGSQKKSAIPDVALKPKHPLNAEQKKAVDALSETPGFQVSLLFGVTGSGKTEVYLEILEKNLAQGRGGLVLVPEISLTPQLLRRFAERFGQQNIATLHSQLTPRERTEQWWSVVSGQKKILVGARSALFCPIPNLGLIAIDEEHEASFKQEEKLKYHARDAAIMLAKEHDCPVILGSATPSLDSWKNARDGKYRLIELKNRVEERLLPRITVVDLRTRETGASGRPADRQTGKQVQDQAKQDPAPVPDSDAGYGTGLPACPPARLPGALPRWMSPPLFDELRKTLNDGDQAALFLNRRGFSSSVVCVQCGASAKCPDCDINLTLHGKKHLVCHYCNYSEPYREDCSHCGGAVLPMGLGTEQIEQDVTQLFPQARIARADRDEIQTRQALEAMVHKMENREIDILIGTQMIAKGLDFTHLRFAGLVLADIGFNLPDFRATERSYQLLTQMSGRVGRHGTQGRVLIQTYNPEHPSVRLAARGLFTTFAEHELSERAQLNYPPFHRLAVIRIQSQHRDRAWSAAMQIRQWLDRMQTQIEILGPAEAPLARIKRAFRFHILLKSPTARTLEWIGRQILERRQHLPPGTKVGVDIDPLNLL